MGASPIPEHLQAFIADHVSSVEALEVLVALAGAPDRWWDPGLLALQLGLSARRGRMLLDALASRNLLDIRVTDDIRYRFRPATAEQTAAVQELMDLYRQQPGLVLRHVAKLSRRGLIGFAGLFRLKNP